MQANLTSCTWLFGVQPRPAAHLRLFCFHHAGGGASFFRQWAHYLPDEIEVCPVQLPGRENRMREALRQDFQLLVAELAQALTPFLDKPFAFFGHSMGALLGYGLANHLRSQNRPLPVHLFVSAYRAPQLPAAEFWHHLSDAQLVRKLIELSSANQEILANEELQRFLLPIMRADFAVCESYTHSNEEPLDCPISALGGLQDTRANRDVLDAWRAQTSRTFALHWFPGDHFYVHNCLRPLSQLISHTFFQSTQASLLF